tara:strand:- start:266 stop:469 length:204 start_codon:yes stop_codon:yes gene_type:complete
MSPNREAEISLLERRLRVLLHRDPQYKLNTSSEFIRELNSYDDVKDISSLIHQLSAIESENDLYEKN